MGKKSGTRLYEPGRQTTASLTLLVWGTMGDLFGQLWRRNYGDQPTPAWVAALAGLTPEEVKRGLRTTAESGEKQPPTAPQFRAYCRPPDPRTSEQRAFDARVQDQSEYLALPSPETLASRTATGRRWLGYWYLRGIRKMPAGMTMDDVAELMGDADVEKMDRQVGFYRRVTLAGRHVHDAEWLRAKRCE